MALLCGDILKPDESPMNGSMREFEGLDKPKSRQWNFIETMGIQVLTAGHLRNPHMNCVRERVNVSDFGFVICEYRAKY